MGTPTRKLRRGYRSLRKWIVSVRLPGPATEGLITLEGEARAAYEKGIRQAEKFGHSGMAEDLRLAVVELGDRGPRAG